jgi:hypothetical protein
MSHGDDFEPDVTGLDLPDADLAQSQVNQVLERRP